MQSARYPGIAQVRHGMREGGVREEHPYLLVMNENVDPLLELFVYPAQGGLDVRAQVGVGVVVDVDAASVKLVAMGGVGLDQ